MSFDFDWTYARDGCNEMERDGAEKGSKQECYSYCTHELMRARGRCFFLKKIQTAIQSYLSLHVEKYIIQVALLSFLQLQPPKKQAKPSQVVNAMLQQSPTY